MRTLDFLENETLRRDLPPFKVGDTVAVHVRVREGDKERIQVFQGVVIRRRGGGVGETFTVRKISSGVGVERIFPVQSPNVTKVEIKSRGHVRRAKLFYLRELSGKKARLRAKVRDIAALNALEAAVDKVGTAAEALPDPEPAAEEPAAAAEEPAAMVEMRAELERVSAANETLEAEVERWKTKAASYAADAEEVPESVQVWRQEKLAELKSEAKRWQDEAEAQGAELAYLKETVGARDSTIAALKRQLEANGLVAALGD